MRKSITKPRGVNGSVEAFASSTLRCEGTVRGFSRGFSLLGTLFSFPRSAWLIDGVEGMTNQQLLERITVSPKVMTGKPVIKGTRLTVEYILNLLAHGATMTEILQEYERLTQDDLRACLLFAACTLDNTVIAPLADANWVMSCKIS